MKARRYDKYQKEVVPALREKHKYTNVHQIPKLEKIVVNMGVSASLEKSAIDDAAAFASEPSAGPETKIQRQSTEARRANRRQSEPPPPCPV